MASDLPIRCACGELRGIARSTARNAGNRVVCYCDDCQSFAWFLGKADRVLDAHGGTDVFQMSSGGIAFHQGAERLACMRLTPGGLMRWYADCCRTPIGNTAPTGQLPFIGWIAESADHRADGRSRDEALGPVRFRLNARFAKGDRATLDAHDRAPIAMILRFVRLLIAARLGGARKTSPFFDPTSGAATVAVRVLSPEELAEIERLRDA